MSVDFKERVLEFIEDYRVVRRILVWGPIIALIYILFFSPYTFSRVNGSTMRPEVRNTEFYWQHPTDQICKGDIVHLEHPESSDGSIRAVMAFRGETLAISDTGFSIGGETVEVSEAWVAAARVITGETGELVVPDAHFLARRTAPDAADPENYEAFLIVPIENVNRVFSTVLASLNPARIGHSLRSDSDECVMLEKTTSEG